MWRTYIVFTNMKRMLDVYDAVVNLPESGDSFRIFFGKNEAPIAPAVPVLKKNCKSPNMVVLCVRQTEHGNSFTTDIFPFTSSASHLACRISSNLDWDLISVFSNWQSSLFPAIDPLLSRPPSCNPSFSTKCFCWIGKSHSRLLFPPSSIA